tara:strand:- start:70 stop:312 length:243 start_codon:yes stop_codon:yes gene_type:complete
MDTLTVFHVKLMELQMVNPIARIIRLPQYKQRIVRNKKKYTRKLKYKPSKRGASHKTHVEDMDIKWVIIFSLLLIIAMVL